MGVQGLWTLLAPAGKKIKLETLAGQRLAIDASIWILHIIHGYISAGKKEFRKAHLIGIFKRLIKLLTLKIKPVFVFDGQAPELKRQTLILRYNLREKRKKNLKKLAERYIVKKLEQRLKGEDQKGVQKNDKKHDSDSDFEWSDLEFEDDQKANDEANRPLPKERALLDFEFDSILEDHAHMLKEEGWNLESFKDLDISDQYDIIRKIRERIYEKRFDDYLQINSLEEYSKFHIKERIRTYEKKTELDQKRREAYKEELVSIEEATLANDKILNKFFTNQDNKNRKVFHEKMASNFNKSLTFIRINEQQNSFLPLEEIKKPEPKKKKKLTQWQKKLRLEEEMVRNQRERDMERIKVMHEVENYVVGKKIDEKKAKPAEEPKPIKKSPLKGFELLDSKANSELKSKEPPLIEEQKIVQNSQRNEEEEDEELDDDQYFSKTPEKTQSFQENTEGPALLKFLLDDRGEISEEKIKMLSKLILESNLNKDTQSFNDETTNYTNETQSQNEFEFNKKIFDKAEKKEVETFPKRKLLFGAGESDSKSVDVSPKFINDSGGFETNSDQKQASESFSSLNSSEQKLNSSEEKPNKKAQENEQKVKETLSAQKILESKIEASKKKALENLMKKVEKNEGQGKEPSVFHESKENSPSNHRQNESSEGKNKQSVDLSDREDSNHQIEAEKASKINIKKELTDLDDVDNMNIYDLMEEYQKYVNLNNLDSESIQSKIDQVRGLLELFGVPWVESPAEAEAQCAFLEMTGLVDGVITEDSDVFLFGGKRVFKNIFDRNSFVHIYESNCIEKELGLSRDQLIYLALFLGSDYTLGIKGVGIVNAMEIVNTFDSVEGLKRFRDWAQAADILLENAKKHYEKIPVKELQYKLFHKNYKKSWELPDEFPNIKVIEAYKKPFVDQSKEKFQWGTPDLEKLKIYCREVFEWDDEYINEYMKPLVAVLNDKTDQKKITDYFEGGKFAVIESKRLIKAIKGLRREEFESKKMEDSEISDSLKNAVNVKEDRSGKRDYVQMKAGEDEGEEDLSFGGLEALESFKFSKRKTKK